MKCLNWKVIGGLAVALAVIAVAAPGAFSTVLPFAVALACPLSMVVMMGAMAGGSRARRDDDTPAPAADPSKLDQLRAEVADLRARQRS